MADLRGALESVLARVSYEGTMLRVRGRTVATKLQVLAVFHRSKLVFLASESLAKVLSELVRVITQQSCVLGPTPRLLPLVLCSSRRGSHATSSG